MIRYLVMGVIAVASAIYCVNDLSPRTAFGGQEIPADSRDVEVLARGPVHEAFAEPIVFDPRPGVVVPKAPPELIEEMPPDQKPAGDHVVWIPGYWSWDQDRNDFLWISGFWRALPPGREWVPGYWTEGANGWQFVSGFWANASDDEIQYLPQPPETLEAGPSTPPPSPDHFWVPGMWYWRDGRYVWRPGYWTVGQSNWVWIPAHYNWTPRGCVFITGFWDYAPPLRGVLFAPVYFGSPFYRRPGYYYTPTMALDLAIVTNHFFIGFGQRQYYFGDYYAANYLNSGIYPWFSFSSTRLGFDPLYAYYSNQFGRTDRNWATRVRSDYERRRDDENARPPRTVALRSDRPGATVVGAAAATSLVKPLSQIVSTQAAPTRMENLQQQQRAEFAKVARNTRDFTTQRMQLESKVQARGEVGATPQTAPKRGEVKTDVDTTAKSQVAPKEEPSVVKRPKSPIVDRSKPAISRGGTDVGSRVGTASPQSKDEPKSTPQQRATAPKAVPRTTLKPVVPETPAAPKLQPQAPNPNVEPKKPVSPPQQPRVEPPKAQPQPPKVEAPRVTPNPPANRVAPAPVNPPAPPKVEPSAPRRETVRPPRVEERPRGPKPEAPRREKEKEPKK